MPDVLMLCINDWANTGWRLFKALQSLGYDVLALKGQYHRMAYPEQIPIHPYLMTLAGQKPPIIAPKLKEYAENASVVHFMASDLIYPGVNLSEKKVVVQHGGTPYRRFPDYFNRLSRHITDATVVQTPDLLGLGAKNEHLVYFPVDTDFIAPEYSTGDRLKIGHFPSNPEVKGTAKIMRVIEKLETDPELSKRFEYVGIRGKANERWGQEFIRDGLITWTDSLRRVSPCDIIIETLASTNYGKPYGEWGNTALEAAAMGKIVVSNCLFKDVYLKEYGKLGINVANTADELEAVLRRILSLTSSEIRREKEKSRAWAVDNHSIKASAARIYDRVYKHLL